jgi:nickel transport system substrate-binding protein
MSVICRRRFLASSAGLALASNISLPSRVWAAEHATLRIATGAEVGDLDLLQNVSGFNAYTMVFEPLVRYGQRGEILPALAEKWEVSPDGKRLTFDLRQGVTFSDGTSFDAKVAEWNLLRWMGKDDFSWIGISQNFDKLVVEGSHRITIYLKAPVPAALYELTIIRPVRFLSPKAVDANGKQSAPIGTGPWTIIKNDNSETILIRNDSYWGPKPAFERAELKVVTDELSRANALRAGDLDIIGGDWVAPLSPRRAKTMSNEGGVTVYTEPGTATLVMGFNSKRPVLADPAVRQAVNVAVDRAAIAKILFEGYADPTADLFPALIPSSGTRHPIPLRDVANAKQILADAGWVASGNGWEKDGKTLELELVSSEESLPGARRLSELLQAMLGEVGIALKVSSVDNATFHERRPGFD